VHIKNCPGSRSVHSTLILIPTPAFSTDLREFGLRAGVSDGNGTLSSRIVVALACVRGGRRIPAFRRASLVFVRG
jgi:hypothetical protein